MSSAHIERKRKIKSICKMEIIKKAIEEGNFTEREKHILHLRYVKGNDFGFIADTVGLCEGQTCRIHKCALEKMEKLIE